MLQLDCWLALESRRQNWMRQMRLSCRISRNFVDFGRLKRAVVLVFYFFWLTSKLMAFINNNYYILNTYCVLGTVQFIYLIHISSSQQHYEVNTIITFILQMRRVKLRKLMSLMKVIFWQYIWKWSQCFPTCQILALQYVPSHSFPYQRLLRTIPRTISHDQSCLLFHK